MGTRGAYGFRMDGKDKVTYNHFDSYPSGLGEQVASFIYATPDDVLIDMFNRIQLVDQDKAATLEQQQECKEYFDADVANGDSSDWYCLLRGAQGDLNVYHKIPYMLNYSEFLLDGVFCEWAYIINLDDLTFEVYKGKQYDHKTCNGRYAIAGMKQDKSRQKPGGNLYCVSLIKVVPLERIRSGEFNWEQFVQTVHG